MLTVAVLSITAAWVLLGSGVAKIVDPTPTGRAMTVVLGRLFDPWAPRALGMIEVIAATAFLITPNRPTAAGGFVVYLGIAAAAGRLRATESECGCFGGDSAPVTVGHLVVTLIAAGSFGLLSLYDLPLAVRGHAGLLLATIPGAMAIYAMLAPMPRLRTALAGRAA